MTVKPNEAVQKTETATPPRVSLSGERLHFVSHRRSGPRQGLRLRLTGGLVGRR